MNVVQTIGSLAAASALLGCATAPPAGEHLMDTGRDLPPPTASVSNGAEPIRTEMPPAQAPGRPWRNSLAFLVGVRDMDDDAFWAPVDEPGALGIEAGFRPPDSNLGFEVGVSTSLDYDDVQDIVALIGEVYAGPRVTWDLANDVVHPYIAGGVTYMLTDVEAEILAVDVSDDDTSIGAYAHGGIYFKIGGGFTLGVDVRGNFLSDISLFGTSTDADYIQYAAFLGAAW